MSDLLDSVEKFVNVEGLKAYIKALEVELTVMKALHDHLGLGGKGGKPGRPSKTKSKKRAKVKKFVLAYLSKYGRGRAMEIAKLSGLKVTSVNQTLFGLKKAGHVKKDKKRGSPFVLVKK